MRACDIKQGEVYRLKSSPTDGYIKVFCVLKPKQSIFYRDFNGIYRYDKNQNTESIVRCIHSVNKSFDFGVVRDFKPSDIIKNKELGSKNPKNKNIVECRYCGHDFDSDKDYFTCPHGRKGR
jgi:hypothetical protein